MEIILDHIEALPAAADKLIEYAGSCKKWTFTGEIGAGKTTFIQSICKKIGVENSITSPTFSLVNEYFYDKNGKLGKIYHIDLYRLNHLEEAIDIGMEDFLYDENYTFIEWPQLIQPILPEKVIEINLEILDNSKRKLIFL